MRRLVAALVMAALALSLTACGGGGDTTSAAPPPAPAATPAAAPVAAPASATSSDAPLVPTTVSATNILSPGEADANMMFPVGQHTPKAVGDRLAAHQPMLVYFYDPEQNTSDDQRDEIDAVLAEYRGMIDLVSFDVTGALPDQVTNAAPKDKVAEQISLLTQDLKIGFTPYVVLVDKRGVMTGRYRGFVDRALLEREVLKAIQ